MHHYRQSPTLEFWQAIRVSAEHEHFARRERYCTPPLMQSRRRPDKYRGLLARKMPASRTRLSRVVLSLALLEHPCRVRRIARSRFDRRITL